MHLDHVTFAVGPRGMDATAAELSEALGAPFLDGGIHPRFGTRNRILPLRNRQYLELVEVLDHPAADKMAFGQAVRERSEAGGGWLHWCLAVDELHEVEERMGRHAVPGNRHRPDGFNLEWRQIGTSSMRADPQLPYVTKWEIPAEEHPSQMAPSELEMTSMAIAGDPQRVADWLGERVFDALESIEVDWAAPNGLPGIMSVRFDTPHGSVRI